MTRCRTIGSGLVLATILWAHGAMGGADPSASQLVAGWKSLGDGSLPAKVVYWEAGAIRILDLTTGKSASILKIARSGDLSVGPYPVWSPDGTRILFFDPGPPRKYKVMNADGSNVKTVQSGAPWTYGTCSWWGDDWVCVLRGDANKSIVRIRIDANNQPVETVAVVDFAPYGGKGREWISMSGDYVAWTDWGANGSAGNRSIVRNWKTGKELEVIPRNEDACSITLKQDGSGTSIYSRNSHWLNQIQKFDGTITANWKIVDGGLMEMPRWSNHPDYITTMDNRQKKDPTIQRSWIRKATPDGKPDLLLGWGMWGADLRVDMDGGGSQTNNDTQAPKVVATHLGLGGTVSDTGVAQIDVNGTKYSVVSGNWQANGTRLLTDPTALVLAVTDNNGNSSSRTVDVRTGSAAPALAAPSTLALMAVSDTEVFLSWVDNTNNEDGFRIYRNAGSGFTMLTTVAVNAAGHSDITVVAGQSYAYYVVAHRGTEESSRSNEESIKAGAPEVSVLTPLSGAALTLGQMVDIRWTTNVPDFDAEVRLSLDGGGTWTVLQLTWAPNASPWPWKVGYKNSETDPSKPPIWQQVVTASNTNCKLLVSDYTAFSITGYSQTFTINVP